MEKELRELHEKIDYIIEALNLHLKASIHNETLIKVEDYLKSSAGKQVILNAINKNKNTIQKGLK